MHGVQSSLSQESVFTDLRRDAVGEGALGGAEVADEARVFAVGRAKVGG